MWSYRWNEIGRVAAGCGNVFGPYVYPKKEGTGGGGGVGGWGTSKRLCIPTRGVQHWTRVLQHREVFRPGLFRSSGGRLATLTEPYSINVEADRCCAMSMPQQSLKHQQREFTGSLQRENSDYKKKIDHPSAINRTGFLWKKKLRKMQLTRARLSLHPIYISSRSMINPRCC